MKKFFQYILMTVALIVTASCSNELDEVLQPAGNGNLQFVVSDFPAFGESPDTRVIGTQDVGKTAWEEGDKLLLSISFESGKKQGYTLEYLSGVWTLNDKVLASSDITGVLALYAPDCEIKSDGSIGLASGKLYGMAEYIPAKTTVDGLNVSISFKDVTRTYSRLRLASEAGQELTVVTTGFTPAGAKSAVADDYTLTTDDNGNAFLYGTFAVGATVRVCSGNVEMESHTFTDATEECVSYALDALYPYLTFTASSEQTMTINTNRDYTLDESMQYSVNGGEWVQLTVGTAITFGGDNGALRLRGKSANGTATSSSVYALVSFGDDNVQVACSGDIRTLVDYENYATVSTANARFCYLFNSCTSLTTAPDLPAMTLADYCYDSMFRMCTKLAIAPELPATTLADYCYYSMFEGCTSLTTAPDLPATTMRDYCYDSMFYGCKNLTAAPELRATTLADYCYYSMFYGCTNLTAAPELPATTLADYCYNYMFHSCTKLTIAHKLPATTLALACYRGMFNKCTSLTTAPELPATTLRNYCYDSMFYGCTKLTIAPKLPATTLANNCYYSMFYGCTSLTKAPELPAKTLVFSCYYRMFYGCKNLNNITMLATNISANYCLDTWVDGVASTGTFTKASAMTSLPSGTSGIPEGWTVVNK